MAVESTDLPFGTPAPDFALLDVTTGKSLSLADIPAARALLVMFICRHCPYVKHVVPEIGRIARDYAATGVSFVAISSNDPVAYPEDAPDSLREMASIEGWSFPFLFDATQDVARAYQAVCTPEFYVFDGARRLAYHGQLDDSRHKNQVPLSGTDLRRALDCVLSGEPIPSPQKVAVGCSIKWRA